jgi:two-component system LytT family response regulator
MKALRQTRINKSYKAKEVPLWPADNTSAAALPFTKVTFQVMNGVEFVDPREVTYLEAQSNYTIIYSITGRRIMVSRTLKECSTLFPKSYLRIHHSYLVNPNHIETYLRHEHACRLDNGVSIPVSRSGKAVMQNFLSK